MASGCRGSRRVHGAPGCQGRLLGYPPLDFLQPKEGPFIFTGLPIFLSFAWALNIWTACDLALVLGVNMREAMDI